jgi:arylsulfatase A-like enzyme
LKGSLYEGGIRVPMIARWTGRVDPGSRTDIQTCFYDLLPTFADVASISPPADVDGISILPTITGDATGQERHNYLYWELGDQTAVISKQWKAIKPQRNSDWELYNLSEDPSEQKNLADLRAEVLQQLVSFAEQAHTQPRPMPSIPRAEYRMFIR